MFSSVSWRGYRAVLLEQMYRFSGLQTTNRRLEICQLPVDRGLFAYKMQAGTCSLPAFYRIGRPSVHREAAKISHAQKRCLPICTISGRDQIHWLVAVTGLK